MRAARVDILPLRDGALVLLLFLFASLSTRETTRGKEKKRKKLPKTFGSNA